MRARSTSIAACMLLLLLWGLLVTGGRALSISMDEPLDVISGYIYLARWPGGLWHLPYHIQPPFLNVIHALLLFAAQPHIPVETLTGWGENYVQFVAAFLPYLMPLERTAILARTPVMLLATLLGALVFRWGKELAGYRVGLLALAILMFDPLFLAHSRFATTDLGVTTVGTATLYAAWRWLKQPSWKWTLITGGLMGVAVLTKYSAFTLVATFALVALASIFCRWKSEGPLRLLQAAVVSGMAILFIWAAFGFGIGQSPIAPFQVPAPMYWTAFYELWVGSVRRIFVAFGKTWVGPQWWYFPLNIVIKNPIPLLLGLLFSGAALIRRRLPIRPGLLGLAVFPCLYILTSISGGMNVSYRHMLPVHPFIYLFVAWGTGFWMRASRPRWQYLAWGLLGLWYILGTLRLFPDELTFFNELVGGPEKAHRYFVDYTQDWGQSMKQLKAYLDAHPGPEPYVAYYTHVRPEYYGIRYRSLSPSPGATHQVTPFYPQPGRYAIGIATLYGLVGRDRMELEWFRRAIPRAMVGHAYYVYEVNDQPRWLFQCSTPSPPLDAQAISRGFASPNLRVGTFDCTHGWLYPDGGNSLGVYALHGHLLRQPKEFLPSNLRPKPMPSDPFIARHISDARLSYWQSFFGLLPAFALYERGAGPALQIPAGELGIGTAENPLSATPVVDRPVRLGGPLAFLGAGVYRDGQGLDVETWWQVTEGPIARPFSIMGHLLTPSGEVLGVSDGLAVSPVELFPGDILVQRHRFDGVTGEGFLLRTGAYWLDTMERWPVAGEPGADAVFIRIHANPFPSEAR